MGGRLEVFMAGQWGTICSSLFTKVEADVACRQLGYHQSREYGAHVSNRYKCNTYHATVSVQANQV